VDLLPRSTRLTLIFTRPPKQTLPRISSLHYTHSLFTTHPYPTDSAMSALQVRRPLPNVMLGWSDPLTPHWQDFTVEFQVKLLSERGTVPSLGSEFAAGMDLYSAEHKVVPARGKALVDLQLSVAVPTGHYGRVAPRSGLGECGHGHVGRTRRRRGSRRWPGEVSSGEVGWKGRNTL
jgi:hypothetical protein